MAEQLSKKNNYFMSPSSLKTDMGRIHANSFNARRKSGQIKA
jgi:hypothetical protein